MKNIVKWSKVMWILVRMVYGWGDLDELCARGERILKEIDPSVS